MGSSTIRRVAVQRAIQTALRFRPCTFFVEHATVTTRDGGAQGDVATRGPYRGMLSAPQADNSRDIGVTAGMMALSQRWTLLATPAVKVGAGSGAEDYVRVDGFGRFRVGSVRPFGDILPPVGLIVGLDEQT